MSGFRMCPVGDQAILCEFGNKIDEKINDDVQALPWQIKSASICQGWMFREPKYRKDLLELAVIRQEFIRWNLRVDGG